MVGIEYLYNTLDVNLQIQIFFGIDGGGSSIATNGTDGVYIYGFQLEAETHLPTSQPMAQQSNVLLKLVMVAGN